MNRANIAVWLARLAWGVIVFDLILIFILPETFGPDAVVILVAISLWLVLSLWLATTGLMVYYRRIFYTWAGWALPVTGLIASNTLMAAGWPEANSRLSLLVTLTFATCTWGVGVATALLLWRRDAGLGMLGWMLAAFTWVAFFAWRIHGNLIEISFLSINNPNATWPLWWINPLFCLLGWSVPLGIASFCIHTVKIIAREYNAGH